MTTKTTLPAATTISETQNSDAAKLLSLLALATGAVAMPETSNASIIFTDLSSAPVTVGFSSGANSQFVINNLPGDLSLRFFRTVFRTTTPWTMTTNAVSMRSNSFRAYLRVKRSQNFLAVTGPGKIWDQLPGTTAIGAMVGLTTSWGGRAPFAYNNKYMGFKFQDASNGGRLTYGWVSLSLSFTTVGPDVTILGYAYDNLGNQIPMGATDPVPEPSSAALLALGALALGAKGVRSWRRNRVAASQS